MELQTLKHVELSLQGTTSMLATGLHQDMSAPWNSPLSEKRSDNVDSNPRKRPESKNKPESSSNKWFIVDTCICIYNEASTPGTESSSSSRHKLLVNNEY
jgi:hypothetical protein